MKNLLIGLCLFSSFAFAVPQGSDWKVVYKESNGDGIYFLPSSDLEDSNGRKSLWLRIEDSNPDDGVYMYDLSMLVNCGNSEMGVNHIIEYDKNGRQTDEMEISPLVAPMEAVDLEDIFESTIYKLACQ